MKAPQDEMDVSRLDKEWNRQAALNHTISLFTHTDFKKLLINPQHPLMINDVTFYAVLSDIYAFLNTGKLPAYEQYKKSQKKV